MFSSRFALKIAVFDPTADPSTPPTATLGSTGPDYAALVRFLVEPFLESPGSLKVDCESSPSRARVLIRLAFEGEDKGRVFGRGGRNIQAIRTVLQAVAQVFGHSVHLDVFGGQPGSSDGHSDERSHPPPPRSQPRRPTRSG
ncbi:KH domain-containing protein [Oculatella sp. LEGE 06141]|uniref:KH domain-containing protein n=1 Tax=Oculatella sp. LEGE 06141 TaxID=1828648 RepID=UPI00187DFFC9|nr:KH domain-containing protein [Oculatella sp. LEGE 06141]MBE9182311.1 KH domain-containing protein [Oculatella sp. LEGE 06141]